jgi:hypothetical protein
MADQFKNIPLLGILAELLATPQGQRIATDYKTAQDGAIAANDYASAAPDRMMERATNGTVDGGEALGTGLDMALLLGGGAGLLKGGMAAGKAAWNGLRNAEGWATDGAKFYSKAIGPELPADAANYTDKHGKAGQEAFRKLLGNPDKDLNRTTLKQEYLKNVARSGAKNAGPQGQQLDDMVANTMGMLNPKTNLRDPSAIERQVQIATGNKRNGKPFTLGLAGAVGAGAAMEGEQDPQTAQVAEIIRRIRGGQQ